MINIKDSVKLQIIHVIFFFFMNNAKEKWVRRPLENIKMK